MFPVLAGGSKTGYNLTRSLRFRASASATLSRTPATTTNRQIFTWSGWVKLGAIGSANAPLFQGYLSSTERTTLGYQSDILYFIDTKSGTSVVLGTAAVYRDPSAWYHVVAAVDTTQATASNRTKIYVNNVLQTVTGSYVAQNTNTYINANNLQYIGNDAGAAGRFFDGYLAEVNFIDGQALTPSSFGSTNALTGVWQPARYTGTYGTNGFYLPFTDNSALTTSSNVGLGKDFSGNGNYWTTNNISITSGVTYDSMTDVPTLTSATAANFAVLNPLDFSVSGVVTLSNGNLTSTGQTVGFGFNRSTMACSFKSYYEVYCTDVTGKATYIGFALPTGVTSGTGVCYYNAANGSVYLNASIVATYATFATGDVIGCTFDPATGSATFYKNNTLQGSVTTGFTGNVFAAVGDGSSSAVTLDANFGQRPFSYTPPSGFVALNTYNLPTSTILKGNSVMDATLYTGTLLSNAITNAASFKPDLVWVKSRSAATSHKLTDSVRGVTIGLVSNTTAAETTDTQGLTAFGSAGFTVGTNTDYNNLAATYVGWQWQAGQGSSSSNTNGTITSTVSVNASAGFSVVTYTGTGVNATVGHGLGVAPQFIIVKQRSITGNWQVYHSATGNTQSSFLNSTATPSTSALYWNSTSPTSSVFSLGSAGDTNTSGATYVAYCWTPISGFSSIGSYVGNGSNDGVFVYTGFLPKWLLVKNTGQVNDWFVIDSAMNTYNVMGEYLLPNSSAASNTFSWIDFLSNGFKIRNTGTGNNNSGVTQIYAAFASNPFKNALAR